MLQPDSDQQLVQLTYIINYRHTSTSEMTSPHLVPAVIAPRKSKSTELLECVFSHGTGFGRHHFRGDDIDRGFLREVFSTRFPMPL